jgi:hypothetical protein
LDSDNSDFDSGQIRAVPRRNTIDNKGFAHVGSDGEDARVFGVFGIGLRLLFEPRIASSSPGLENRIGILFFRAEGRFRVARGGARSWIFV